VSLRRPLPCWPGGYGRLFTGQLGLPHTAAPTLRHIRCLGPIFCMVSSTSHRAPPKERRALAGRTIIPALPGGWHMVGTAGFEPATSASRTLRATKLRYVPSAARSGRHPVYGRGGRTISVLASMPAR
jgi:hypothetical protein